MTITRAWGSPFIGVAVALFAWSTASAQETARLPQQLEQVAPKSEDSQIASVGASLVGVDRNSNGIRDDIEAFVALETKASAEPSAASSAVKTELSSALQDRKQTGAEPARRTCLDYLLLEPKDQVRANRHLQTSSDNGIFGTHPCDPFVSPNLERPFDTGELQLGPARLRE